MASTDLKHSGGGLSRRRFLQGLAVGTVAAAGLTSCAPATDSGDDSLSETGEGSGAGYQYDWETAEGEIGRASCRERV